MNEKTVDDYFKWWIDYCNQTKCKSLIELIHELKKQPWRNRLWLEATYVYLEIFIFDFEVDRYSQKPNARKSISTLKITSSVAHKSLTLDPKDNINWNSYYFELSEDNKMDGLTLTEVIEEIESLIEK